ncbi:MAG: preprotein translocase subunit SecA [Epsilonproteobacteria bacterium]|nr:preprotein translocase subunit SecA [Campylobacterota bacterium]
MLSSIAKKIFGTKNERVIKELSKTVELVNNFGKNVEGKTNIELAERISELKPLAQEEKFSKIMPEVFAIVREIAGRTLGMRPFDVQIVGAVVLANGKIAEMKTGEGKTLAAALPLVLNAMAGKGAHLVTVNDYLAKRDALWMAPVYLSLGFSVGIIQSDTASYLIKPKSDNVNELELVRSSRKDAYSADITYGTNNEFGFDYLRDNMSFDIDDYVQRGFYFAVVDEVDSVLIDEARTPLIISGPTEDSTEIYYQSDAAIKKLSKDDYEIDEKNKQSTLKESGVEKIERFLKLSNLYDSKNIKWVHAVDNALRANTLFKNEVDYLVKDGQILIVDEFTGRALQGRRYSDGLHQALEAKEHVKIQKESQTYATITLQNYFRMYKKLSGMTGTADTEAGEFKEIYDLDVVVIPTNKKLIRDDKNDLIFKTGKERNEAVVNEIAAAHKAGQPTLIGTTSVENSEIFHRMLKSRRLPHVVLNAKHHEQEAKIIENAGKKGAITIATSMAGRGVDIKLDEDAKKAGGLYIIGTERQESRRVDNQLRGRSGRQGDPGKSRFFLSLDDNLLRIFGSDRIKLIMNKLGTKYGEPIESKMVTKAVENAQKKVELFHFNQRKHLLEYDDVMNIQREAIYSRRKMIFEGTNLKNHLFEAAKVLLNRLIGQFFPEEGSFDDRDISGLRREFRRQFHLEIPLSDDEMRNQPDTKLLLDLLYDFVKEQYNQKEELIGEEQARELERAIMINTLDALWKDHLYQMDGLRDAVGLRGYGQRDPLVEYKKESYELFQDLIFKIDSNTAGYLFGLKIVVDSDIEEKQKQTTKTRKTKRKKRQKR